MKFQLLMIDDDRITLMLHKRIVKKSNFHNACMDFDNPKEALAFLQENSEMQIPCIILLDINMPEMNGWQFLDAIQKCNFLFPIYVAMLTSSIDVSDRLLAQKYSMVFEYFCKPFDLECIEKIKNSIPDKGIFLESF